MQVRLAHLHGNGLPARWAGRPHFVVLDTHFGLGHHFLAIWHAWRNDLARCARLHVVAVAAEPPSRTELALAHAASPVPALAAALLKAWPPLTPNLHMLDFESGRLQLTLAVGDAPALLRALRLQADAIFLEASPSACTPHRLKAVARLATVGALVTASGGGAALAASLRTAGFEVQPAEQSDGAQLTARYAPRHKPRGLPRLASHSHNHSRSAVVVGAGLAGAAAAQALARQGLAVTVLEREDTPAQTTSGNPAGLFHGTVNAADGHYARLYRAAALTAANEYRDALASGGVTGQVDGLLRLAEHDEGTVGLQALLQRLGLPAEYVEVLDAAAASQRAGVLLHQACWHFPSGGWLAPASWVRHALRTPGVTFQGGTEVTTLLRDGNEWWLLDAAGALIERSGLVVLANAADAARLLSDLGHAPWPLRQTRGQVTHWRTDTPTPLRLPVAGDGYALPLAEGLLCGATRQDDDADPRVRHADDLHNVARLQQLTGLLAPDNASLWQGRAGQRLHSEDNLPIAGAVPASSFAVGQRMDQVRLLPREPGLFVLTALGARGLTLAPLLGRLVAAQATGTPWPLEQDLADALDPARWIVRAARALTRVAVPG